jgi:hypothetical protein
MQELAMPIPQPAPVRRHCLATPLRDYTLVELAQRVILDGTEGMAWVFAERILQEAADKRESKSDESSTLEVVALNAKIEALDRALDEAVEQAKIRDHYTRRIEAELAIATGEVTRLTSVVRAMHAGNMQVLDALNAIGKGV